MFFPLARNFVPMKQKSDYLSFWTKKIFCIYSKDYYQKFPLKTAGLIIYFLHLSEQSFFTLSIKSGDRKKNKKNLVPCPFL